MLSYRVRIIERPPYFSARSVKKIINRNTAGASIMYLAAYKKNNRKATLKMKKISLLVSPLMPRVIT